MLFFIFITLLIATIIGTVVVVIPKRDDKVNAKKVTPASVVDVSLDSELNILKKYIYHVDGDESLQSTLGSNNPIYFKKVSEDGEVFKMTLDGYEIGYNDSANMIISQASPFDFKPMNFKLYTTGGDDYMIVSESGDKYVMYDRLVGAFYLLDEKNINSERTSNLTKMRISNTRT